MNSYSVYEISVTKIWGQISRLKGNKFQLNKRWGMLQPQNMLISFFIFQTHVFFLLKNW